MSSYAEGRKPHRHVAQSAILEALREVGPSRLDDIAEHFGVSEATIRRKLDGATAQGLARVWPGVPRKHKAEYAALDAHGEVERGEAAA